MERPQHLLIFWLKMVPAMSGCGKVHIDSHIAWDGAEAMPFCSAREHANVPRPDLILLDLNLPKKDGREVLEEINENPDLKVMPVVTLTTYSLEADMLWGYQAVCELLYHKTRELRWVSHSH